MLQLVFGKLIKQTMKKLTKLALSVAGMLLVTLSSNAQWEINGNNIPIPTGPPVSQIWKVGAITGTPGSMLNIIHYNIPRISIRENEMYLGNMSSPITINYSTTNNNVGIGTTSPTSKLHVSGDILSTNDIKLGTDASNVALSVNTAEALWYNGTYFSWGYGGQYNFFGDGISVGYPGGSVPTPPSLGMAIKGKVGIGTSTPAAKLHVMDDLIIENSGNGTKIKIWDDGANSNIETTTGANDGLLINYYTPLRQVAIGNTTHADPTDLFVAGDIKTPGNLTVCQKIMTSEVEVASTWCDYVFEKDYQLMSIEELDKYIKENKHLPNIPAATEVENNGLKMADMQRRMMEKIEELSLYVIQLKKQNDDLQKKVDSITK